MHTRYLILALGILFGGIVCAQEEPILDTQNVTPTNIPWQVEINQDEYGVFLKEAAKSITPHTNQCALFVNRIFLARFGRAIFGNAWEMQLHPDNQKYLTLVWRLTEDDYDRSANLALYDYTDRVDHYRRLYRELDKIKNPVGTLGFLYHYSAYREYVAANPKVLPQTHITFVAGRKTFDITNDSDTSQTIEEILVAKHGIIHDFERPLLKERNIPLTEILEPGQSYTYIDYLIEEQFKVIQSNSLLEVFLRKHKNNRTTPLVRPVSYSQISEELEQEITYQKRLKAAYNLTITTPKAEQNPAWNDIWSAFITPDMLHASLLEPLEPTDRANQISTSIAKK